MRKIVIDRDFYLQKLIRRRENGFIKVITGIRRCGKSFLLNKIFYNYLLSSGIDKMHIIKFAFDSADDLTMIGESLIDNSSYNKKVDPKKFLSYINSKIIDNNMYFLLLDEIQLLDSFESVLNGYLRRDNLDIYITGSNSKFLSTDIITEFAGRGDEIHIFPLSFSEFYNTYKILDKEKSTELIYDEYSIYGGLPSVLLMENDEEKINYLKTQVKNVYLKDVARRNNLSSLENLNELLEVLASNISNLVNPLRLSNTFKSTKKIDISEQTVSNYISFFEDAFILRKVKRFDIKGNFYINTPFKIYFEDLGLRNALLSFRQLNDGFLMENIIYNELIYRGFDVDVGSINTWEKDKNSKNIRVSYEVDFVANLGPRRYYIQSSYEIPSSEKLEQEEKSLGKIKDSFKKIIIVGKDIKTKINEKGYVTMSLWNFLLNRESLSE